MILQCLTYIILLAGACSALASEKVSVGRAFIVGIIRGRVFSFAVDTNNYYGELGIGDDPEGSWVTAQDPPTYSGAFLLDPFGSGEIVAVSASAYTAAAIDSSGALFTWGRGFSSSHLAIDPDEKRLPTRVDSFGSGAVVSISLQDFNMYMIDSEGSLFGMGSNSEGQLGKPLSEGASDEPTQIVVDSKKVTAVSAGFHFACVIAEDQMLYCFGNWRSGRLGRSLDGSVDAPTRVAQVRFSTNLYSQVACGEAHSCAFDSEGRVLCWGAKLAGRLGQGGDSGASLAISAVPKLVVAPWRDLILEQLVVGSSHSCVYTLSGICWCWGYVNDVWIPNNDSEVSTFVSPSMAELSFVSSPILMKMDGINKISSLAIGHGRTCVLDHSAMLHCYGIEQMSVKGMYEAVDLTALDFEEDVSSSLINNQSLTSKSMSTTKGAATSNVNDFDLSSTTFGISAAPTPNPASATDYTLHIVIPVAVAFVLGVAVALFVAQRSFRSRKSTRRHARDSARAMSVVIRPHVHSPSSRGSRSKSASRRISLSVNSGVHAKRRSSAITTNVGIVLQGEFTQTPSYVHSYNWISATANHMQQLPEYRRQQFNYYSTLQPDTRQVQNQYERGDMPPVSARDYDSMTHPKHVSEWSRQQDNHYGNLQPGIRQPQVPQVQNQYERGDMLSATPSTYDAMAHPLLTDQYASGDVENLNLHEYSPVPMRRNSPR